MRTLTAAACLMACLASPIALAQEWVVTSLVPKSGRNAATGGEMLAGVQLAFNTANAKGGVAGRKLKLVDEDNLDEVDATLSKAQDQLKRLKPIAFVAGGSAASMDALIQKRVFLDAGIPMVGPKTGSLSAAQSGAAGLFLTRATYGDEIAAILKHCAGSGLKRLAVVYQDDAFGKEAFAAVQKMAPAAGVEVVASASFVPTADLRVRPDVRKAVPPITKSQHQAVLLVSATPGSAAFASDYYQAGGAATLFALSSTDTRLFVTAAGLVAARGAVVAQVVPSPRNEGVPVVRRFISDLRAAGAEVEDVNPTVSFLEGYIAAQVLIEGLRRAGANADSAKLTQALQSLKGFDLGGYALSFDNNSRSGSHFVELAVINAQGEAIR
ncbi:ABC transporter substrate-binding protein [Niveibacterium sp. SC-1]|uniref:ABC transporter substrate-binding protein n=1 Tax=Niveibacterium sp. SC-1 TaxID=3135646 RepID=UPI00311E8977